MKTILKTTVILVVSILGVSLVNAQELGTSEFRAFYGTSYPEKVSDISFKTLKDGVLGNKKPGFSTFGVAGVGYRYNFDRFSVGLDLGYSSTKEEVLSKKNISESFKVKRYLVLPTISYSYYRNGLLDVYGSASAGVEFSSRKKDNPIKSKKDIRKTESVKSKSFAYQVSPIGIRIGNETIGAFVELGYGYKGVASAGISFKF